MRNLWKAVDGLKPALLMLSVQIAFASVNVMYKVAINHGMSVRVLTAYRLIFASAFTIPLALLLERNKTPKLTWRVLFMAFFCGLFGGSLFQNLYFEGLALISATFASAVYNLIPAVTFILAVCCGYEKLNLGKAEGKAKVLGTIIGVGGAMMLTFMKGIEINIWTFHIHLLRHNNTSTSQHGSKLLGVFCGIASCFCFALWLIIQAKMSKEYPKHHSSTALMSTIGAIQSTVFALCIDRDWSQWRLHWNGVVASGIMVIVIAWCVRMRGPLYASVFNPLMLVLVAIAGSLMLDENLYLGSVIGAVLIVVGLYLVLWGKGKEAKKMNQLVPSDQISQQSTAVEIVVHQVSSLSKAEQPVEDSQNKPNDDQNTPSL
ncbi:WAT1-related protein At1g25270-like isoform X2 [Neltuma alba]|uniref:WAT1-related protein At1g25270-like isoform X2 n=1 Tax=Neltuma alba TaxID=207710 RepID=UPI0010A37D24|nr:WAT1-related protein At1g25270-like isoform X2 [Prosopis alba]